MVSDGGVPSVGVVEAFDVVEHRGAGLVPCGEGVPVQEFGFEGGEERLAVPSTLRCRLVGSGFRTRLMCIDQVQGVVATLPCWREFRCSVRASAGVL